MNNPAGNIDARLVPELLVQSRLATLTLGGVIGGKLSRLLSFSLVCLSQTYLPPPPGRVCL